MSLSSMINQCGSALLVVLTIIQLVPIKVNPWSYIARAIGRTLNAEVMEEISKDRATTARYRILRFDEELRHKGRHTKDHFDQLLKDIDTYERYCKDHPNFPNGQAVSAIGNIKRTYERCRVENSFLV